MIPRRIALAGFLSYRDEQEFDFGDDRICMLTGPNGSGKSSVFDAVTFALYGAHRGGKQGVDELITKGRDLLRVEFDFDVAGARYRVQRTARRKGSPTRQVLRHLAEDHWEAEPDTHLEAGFDAWVREHIGLTYEAFTSSVLLLQGRAEKLISAKPAERLVILKEIVGLDRFERLHARVADHHRTLARRVEDVRGRVQAIPAVADEDLTTAEAALVTAESHLAASRTRVDQLIGLELQAREGERIRGEIDVLDTWLARARDALAESDAIEHARSRLAELRETLPHLEIALEQRHRLAATDTALREHEAHRLRLEDESRSAVRAQEATQARLDALRASIPAVERELETLRDRLAEAARLADRARRVQMLASQADAIAAELVQFPADLDGQSDTLALEVARLDAAGRALPALTRLARARDDLRRSEKDARAISVDLTAAEAAVARTRAELDGATVHQAESAAALLTAETRAETARIARANAFLERNALDSLEGRPSCDRCGQPLPPEHLVDERARRNTLFEAAGKVHRAEHRAATAARSVAEAAGLALEDARRRLDESTHRLTSLKYTLERHVRDVDRSARDSAGAFDELAGPFQILVVPEPLSPSSQEDPACPSLLAERPPERHLDWTSTTYPTPRDLKDLRREVAALPEARRRSDEAQGRLRQRAALREKHDDARRAIARESAGLPEDPSAAQRESERLAADVQGQRARLDAIRAEQTKTEIDLDRQRQDQDARLRELAALGQSIARDAGRRESILAALDRAHAALSAPWQTLCATATMVDLEGLSFERKHLEEQGVEVRWERLKEARTLSGAKRERRHDFQRLLDALPAESHRPAAEVQRLLNDARTERDRLDRCRLDAARALDQLRQDRARRGELEAEALAADRECATAEHLADLLGPRNLQRHLVREAEAGILRFADDLLDRLSGGVLTLRLRKPDDTEARVDRALDLEAYNRETKQAISVPFLSGSQRFRIAVCLALGIGRYAGRLHRPIESVIIDEGFGCLDREGRQVMIREIQNLREHVRRIILVSHQEEFAGAFSDGYQLAIRDGTTIATRFST